MTLRPETGNTIGMMRASYEARLMSIWNPSLRSSTYAFLGARSTCDAYRKSLKLNPRFIAAKIEKNDTYDGI